MNNEEWIPIPFVSGECSLSSIEYNAANLSVALDSFVENRTIKVIFPDIFAYRVTLEHMREMGRLSFQRLGVKAGKDSLPFALFTKE